MRPVEILSPAGNMESLKAAVAGGCNAVYLGLGQFSARAFAGNFSHEEYLEAISYCHIRDVKIYVTMNTLLYETELANAQKEIAFLYENDVDGVLVQDLGFFHWIRTVYPDLDVHASTQMHIHNLAGVKWMKKEGAKRVVLARETPIEVIEECCKEDIEIEVFAYGALCVSYSGQCLMSAAMKNRSGNRGMCAQCCRLKYYENPEKTPSPQGEYLLSPKDLNLLENLEPLIQAGVTSLKIEGRMKRPEYVYLITKTFKEAVDCIAQGKHFHLSDERKKQLLLMFNRGFTTGHVFHTKKEDFLSSLRPNHLGIPIGTVVKSTPQRVLISLTDCLHQHDGLRILNTPVDTGLTAVKIEKDGMLVNQASAGDQVWLESTLKPVPKPGQVLLKTSDSLLLDQIHQEIASSNRKTPILIRVQGESNKPLICMITDNRGHTMLIESSQNAQVPQKAPLSKERLEEVFQKVDEHSYQATVEVHLVDSIFLPISICNETRRKALEDLDQLRSRTHFRKGKQPEALSPLKPQTSFPSLLIEGNKEGQIPMLPIVNENETGQESYANCLIEEIGNLSGQLENVYVGSHLNCANSATLEYFLSIPGVIGVVWSSEVDPSSMERSLSVFEKKYGFHPNTYQVAYGRRKLMILKNPTDQPLLKGDTLYDVPGNSYPIFQEFGCTILYEPFPIHKQPIPGVGNVCSFTKESPQEEKEIVAEYEKVSR